MADRLTQLQDCLDQLATQMFASLRYIATRNPPARISGQPNHGPSNESQTPTTNGIVHHPEEQEQYSAAEREFRPDHPTVFNAAVTELAQDLVAKEQQIEVLINSLPGRSRTQAEQQERMRILNEELESMDLELASAALEKEQLLRRVEGVMLKVKRY